MMATTALRRSLLDRLYFIGVVLKGVDGVYFLLRRIYRAYPWAIGILLALLAYQVYTLVVAPTVSMTMLSLLDAVIIVLVVREYRRLRLGDAEDGHASHR